MRLYAIISLLGMLVMTGWWLADYQTLWGKTEFGDFYHFAIRDYYFLGLCVLPSILSHLATIWGHYYRADAIFQESITRVSSSDKKQKVSIWERKDSYFGCTVKYYVLVFIATVVNLAWFGQPMKGLAKALAEGEPFWPEFLGKENALITMLGVFGVSKKKRSVCSSLSLSLSLFLSITSHGNTGSVGYGSGYAAMGACGMILFLVLRRSMLHALGFTYADLLPLHRWMGVAIIFWSVIHTVGYMGHFIIDDIVEKELNFDGETRGPQNIMGFVALVKSPLAFVFWIATFLGSSQLTSSSWRCSPCHLLGRTLGARSLLDPIHASPILHHVLVCAPLRHYRHLGRHSDALPLLHDLVLRDPLRLPVHGRSLRAQDHPSLRPGTRGPVHL